MALYSRSKHKTKITKWWSFWPRACCSAVLKVNKLLFLVDNFCDFWWMSLSCHLSQFLSFSLIIFGQFLSFSITVFGYFLRFQSYFLVIFFSFFVVFVNFCQFYHFCLIFVVIFVNILIFCHLKHKFAIIFSLVSEI